MQIDWSEVESAATASAFVLAAVIYVGDSRAKTKSQATQVSAWLSLEREPGTVPNGSMNGLQCLAKIKNRSDQPIYEVSCWPLWLPAEALSFSVMPPGYEHTEPAPLGLLVGNSVMTADVVLDFRDAAGRRWRRTPRGKLHRLWWFRRPPGWLVRRRPMLSVPTPVRRSWEEVEERTDLSE